MANNIINLHNEFLELVNRTQDIPSATYQTQLNQLHHTLTKTLVTTAKLSKDEKESLTQDSMAITHILFTSSYFKDIDAHIETLNSLDPKIDEQEMLVHFTEIVEGLLRDSLNANNIANQIQTLITDKKEDEALYLTHQYLRRIAILVRKIDSLPEDFKYKSLIKDRIFDNCKEKWVRTFQKGEYDFSEDKFRAFTKTTQDQNKVNTVEVVTWGTQKEISNGLKNVILQQIKGDNVGHAALTIRIPVDRENTDLVNKYCWEYGAMKIPYQLKRYGNQAVYEIYWSFWPNRLHEQKEEDIVAERAHSVYSINRVPDELKERYQFKKQKGEETVYFSPVAVKNTDQIDYDKNRLKYLDLVIEKDQLNEELQSLELLRSYINDKTGEEGPFYVSLGGSEKPIKPNSNFITLLTRFKSQLPHEYYLPALLKSKIINYDDCFMLLFALNNLIDEKKKTQDKLVGTIEQLGKSIQSLDTDYINKIKEAIEANKKQLNLNPIKQIAQIISDLEVVEKSHRSQMTFSPTSTTLQYLATFAKELDYNPLYDTTQTVLSTKTITQDQAKEIKGKFLSLQHAIEQCGIKSAKHYVKIDQVLDQLKNHMEQPGPYPKNISTNRDEYGYKLSEYLNYYANSLNYKAGETNNASVAARAGKMSEGQVKDLLKRFTLLKDDLTLNTKKIKEEQIDLENQLAEAYNNPKLMKLTYVETQQQQLQEQLGQFITAKQEIKAIIDQNKYPAFFIFDQKKIDIADKKKALAHHTTAEEYIIKIEEQLANTEEELMQIKLSSHLSAEELIDTRLSRGLPTNCITLKQFNAEEMLKAANQIATSSTFNLLNENCSTTSMKILRAGAPPKIAPLFQWTELLTGGSSKNEDSILTNPQAVFSASKMAELCLKGKIRIEDLIDDHINNDDAEIMLKRFYHRQINTLLANVTTNDDLSQIIENDLLNYIAAGSLSALNFIGDILFHYDVFNDDDHLDKIELFISKLHNAIYAQSNEMIQYKDPAHAIHIMLEKLKARPNSVPFFHKETLAAVRDYILTLESTTPPIPEHQEKIEAYHCIIDERDARLTCIEQSIYQNDTRMQTAERLKARFEQAPIKQLRWSLSDDEKKETKVFPKDFTEAFINFISRDDVEEQASPEETYQKRLNQLVPQFKMIIDQTNPVTAIEQMNHALKTQADKLPIFSDETRKKIDHYLATHQDVSRTQAIRTIMTHAEERFSFFKDLLVCNLEIESSQIKKALVEFSHMKKDDIEKIHIDFEDMKQALKKPPTIIASGFSLFDEKRTTESKKPPNPQGNEPGNP